MKKSVILSAMSLPLVAASLVSCGSKADEGTLIDKPQFEVPADGIFNIDALEALGRVSNPQLSPDGKKVLLGISYESVEQNKSNNELYVVNIDGSELTRLTKTAGSEQAAVWIDGGERIAFIAADPEKKTPQLWVMNADGSGRKAVTDVENGVNGFVFSPDGKKVVIVSNV